mgnify:CR=1 FL=1
MATAPSLGGLKGSSEGRSHSFVIADVRRGLVPLAAV